MKLLLSLLTVLPIACGGGVNPETTVSISAVTSAQTTTATISATTIDTAGSVSTPPTDPRLREPANFEAELFAVPFRISLVQEWSVDWHDPRVTAFKRRTDGQPDGVGLTFYGNFVDRTVDEVAMDLATRRHMITDGPKVASLWGFDGYSIEGSVEEGTHQDGDFTEPNRIMFAYLGESASLQTEYMRGLVSGDRYTIYVLEIQALTVVVAYNAPPADFSEYQPEVDEMLNGVTFLGS